MIKVSVFYPNTPGSTFDMSYYVTKHMPMFGRLLAPALKGSAVEEGLAGGQPGAPPLYLAMGHLVFDSVEDFQTAWGPHAEAIVGDVPNYTNAQFAVQISEIKL